jgi:hypothetical protein
MSPLDCAALRAAIEPLAAGEPLAPEQRTHLESCPACQASLALAVRLERVLSEWPVAAPAPAFADRVVGVTRREAWRREQVVDWSFNVAIAAGLFAVVAGLAAMAWLLGSAAGPAAATGVMADVAAALVDRMRAQATVVATATLLLTTTLVAWWWAESEMRW